jgi:alpha-L-fucosidase 2
MGFVSAIYEMLLYSDGDKLKLLPALPDEFKKGKIENIHSRGGYNISINWNENQAEAKITATRDGKINVTMKGYTLVNCESKEQSKYDGYALISLKKGESVSLIYKK